MSSEKDQQRGDLTPLIEAGADVMVNYSRSVWTYVFGCPGDGINGVMEALRRRRDILPFVQVRSARAPEGRVISMLEPGSRYQLRPHGRCHPKTTCGVTSPDIVHHAIDLNLHERLVQQTRRFCGRAPVTRAADSGMSMTEPSNLQH
jgi:hypothetical protein